MWRVMLAASACLALTSCATGWNNKQAKQYVPPERGLDWAQGKLRSFREPSFYQPDPTDKFKSRNRLTVSGVACFEFMVRVDQSRSGYLTGVVKHRNRCADRNAFDQHLLRPSAERVEALNAKIEKAGLFEFYPEYWSQDDEDGSICIDGMELIYERWDEKGHGFSQANAPCTANAALIEVVKDYCALSKDDDVTEFCDVFV
jgi:hypothetical protein